MVLFDPVDRTVEVVGEGSYQGTLERIAGGRTEDGARLPDHRAVLLPEPTNPYDVNAIRVVLVSSTDGTSGVVGYLTREHALAYRSIVDRVAADGRVVACLASLRGGWDRGGGDRGSFGVRLHLDSPAGLFRELGTDVPAGTAETEEAPAYANTSCPYCSVTMNPLPKAKRRCPDCGMSVYVRTGPDGLRYLLQAVDLPAMDRAWEDHRAGRDGGG